MAVALPLLRYAVSPLQLQAVPMAQLADLHHALIKLEQNALDPNPFYGPAALDAMRRHLSGLDRARLLLVRGPGGRDVLGLFPLLPSCCGPGGLLGTQRSLSHPYCFLHTPLIAARAADDVLDTFIRSWPRQSPGYRALELRGLDGSLVGPLLQARARALRAPLIELGRHERALLVPAATAEAYLARALRKKRRKEYARLHRRLGEQGRLVFTVHEEPEAVLAASAAFLELEAEGWKGQAGTAMLSAGDAPFLRDFLHPLIRAGRVTVPALTLDGRPLAMLICLDAAGACGSTYLFKIAYDEAFAGFSPGVLLMLDYTRWRHERGLTGHVDSCAQSGHAMIDRLWPDRRALIDALLFPPTPLGRAVGAAVEALHRVRSGLQRQAEPTHESESDDDQDL